MSGRCRRMRRCSSCVDAWTANGSQPPARTTGAPPSRRSLFIGGTREALAALPIPCYPLRLPALPVPVPTLPRTLFRSRKEITPTMAASGTVEPPAQSPNDVKIEEAGPARKRLTITVPAAVIDEKLAESIATLSHEAAIPGFRKGKVPQKLIERKFGSSVRNETKNQLIASAYSEAIEEHKIKPVGEPEPVGDMTKIELEQGKPLTFSLEVEVSPEFELPKFDGIEIKKPVLPITEEMVGDEL